MWRPSLPICQEKFSLIAGIMAFALGYSGLTAATDLADVPLASSSATQVKPNILFILDDSGSMSRTYMPDGVSSNAIGYRSAVCNTVYYNPSVSYAIPQDYAGTNLNDATQTTFSSAYNDGYYSYVSGGSSTKTNLSSSFSADDNESGRAAYYWLYQHTGTPTPNTGVCNYSTGSVTTSTTGICCTSPSVSSSTCSNAEYPTNSPPTCTSGKTLVWKKVAVSSSSGPGSTDERQNFANWYSYYRSRMMMMKAAASRAFGNINNSYRVGFMTICPGTYGCSSSSSGAANGGSVSSSKFLKVSDFDSSHRSDWYSKLYSQTGGSYTPLRSALATAGRYYAGKNDGINKGMIPAQADDPVQYSCQQNFTILTTDGYWNSGSGRKLDGTSEIGNQDGVVSELDAYNPSSSKISVSPRPIYDGATATYTWNSATRQYQTASCAAGNGWQQRTIQYQMCDTPTAVPAITTTLRRDSTNYGSSWGSWYIDAGCTPDSGGKNRTQCQTMSGLITSTSSNSGSTWSDWGAAASPCESDNAGTSRRQCAGGTVTAKHTSINGGSSWSSWTATSSCTEDASGDNRTECRYETATSYTCSGSWSNTQCTNTDPSVTPLCRSSTGSWTNVASCTPSGQDAGGIATECQFVPVTGYKLQYQATTTTTTYSGPDRSGSILSGPSPNTGAWTDVDGVCTVAPPAVPASHAVTDAGPPTPPGSCATWPCETSSPSGGSSDSLSDVAQYYYKTDLRTTGCTGALGTGVDVCANNVPSTGTDKEADRANWQHMTTFTMGLGLSGTVQYSPTYKTDTSQVVGVLDFQDIRGDAANWPVPDPDDPTALDDLWHAAVNGRGQYFSARDPDSVVDSLTTALAGVNARVASAAAAATSNLEPVAGDNFAYTAKYVTQKWTGELEAHEIDLETGVVQSAVIWSAQAKLDELTKNACDSRTIKLYRGGATNNLTNFSLTSYGCDAGGAPTGTADTGLNASEQAYFDATEVALLSQYPTMSTDQRTAAAGANLVNYLRGQRGKEGFEAGDTAKLYRAREHVLGDIVNAQPVYVKAPPASYSDIGYGDATVDRSDFKTDKGSRTPMVYIASNDGMLHGIYAGSSASDPLGGKEAWAFIPTMVLPNLYKLATENYASLHVFSVDGTPTVGDVFDPTASADCALATPTAPQSCWKTILVAGLNKGGQGYYALDVTDPATPKGLWEFKQGTCYDETNATTKAATNGADCHLGYTFNNPIVGKLADGTWAVFVTSGYNNDDGKGYLYVLNAVTGKIIYRIGTGVGTAADPSGLNHINGWVENAAQNNSITRIYGGDLLGNIWRFDVNDALDPAGREATRVATVVDSTGTPQPITTRPELAEVSGSPYVYVATGRYLGSTDTANTQTQTVWGIKDDLTATAVTNLRTTLSKVTITNQGSGTTAYRTAACSEQCTSTAGWYADLPDSGERVNIDMKLQLGTLVVASNVPQSNACNIGGYSWINYFNYKTGLPVSTTVIGNKLADSLAVGLNVIRLPNNKTVVIATTSDAEQRTVEAPFDTPSPTGKRVSWREIID